MPSEIASALYGKVVDMQEGGGTASLSGATSGSGGSRRNRPRGRTQVAPTVTTLPQLLGLIQQFGLGAATFPQVLQSQLFTGQGALNLSPQLYKQLQDYYVTREQGGTKNLVTGSPLSEAASTVAQEQTTSETGTGGFSSSSSQSFQPILPPVLDILDEMRARRAAAREAALANFGAILQAAPVMAGNLEFFPGFEPGGAYDVAMGQVSGKGTEAQKAATPASYRKPQRIPLPALMNPNEPTVGSEFGGAMGFAQQILANLISVLTGTSSSSSSYPSGGGSAGGQLTDEEYINSILGSLPVGAQ